MTVEQIVIWLERVASVGDDYIQMPSREALALIASWRERGEANAELVAALAFYADPETYVAIGFLPDHPCGEFIDDFDETEWGVRPGKRARAALAALAAAGQPQGSGK